MERKMSRLYKISLSLMAFVILGVLGLHNLESCRERKQNRQTRQNQQILEGKKEELLTQIKTYENQIDSLRYRRDSAITELFFLSDSGIQNRLDSLFNTPGYLLP